MTMSAKTTTSADHLSPSMEQRFEKIKLAVRKATEECLVSKEDVRTLQENQSPNESFALGMTLFGQDHKVVERHIQEQLDKLQHDLDTLLQTMLRTSGTFNNDHNVVDDDDDDDDDDHHHHQPSTTDMSPEALQLEASILKTRIAFLRHISHAKTALDDMNSRDNAAAMLVQAQTHFEQAQAIVHAEEQSSLAITQNEQPSQALQGAYRILDSVRTTIRRKRLDFINKARQLLEATVELTEATLTVRGGGDALNMLQELSPEQVLEPTICTMADQLLQIILEPLLKNLESETCLTIVATEREESSSTKGTKYILEWSKEPCTTPLTSLQQWTSTITFYSRVLSFVQKHVLLERELLCQIMGHRLFGKPGPLVHGLDVSALGLESHLFDESGRLMKPMLNLLWDTCIPEYVEPDEFGHLQDTGKSLRSILLPFEDHLVRLHFAEPGTPLHDFSNHFEQKYMEKRRSTLLNQARNILVHNDYHNTSLVGENIPKPSDSVLPQPSEGMSIFKLHRAAVSDTAQKIMELVRRTMDEAIAPYGESLLSVLLYRTARDMLDLFRAIIPSTHATEINSLPRTAAVLHNDCVFLAHHCLTLGMEYKERFPEGTDTRGQLLQQACIFVDMVPPFRELADKAMGDMLEEQRDQLWELVGVRVKLLGQALESNESLMEWNDAETALKAGLHHLKHLSQAWKPVLAYEVYNSSIGFLVDTMFGLFLDQILSAADITESACHFLSSLTSSAMQGVLPMVSTTKSWDRFSAVGRFMEMSLVDVHVALSHGVFANVTGPELSRLIRATFGDSEKRRELLKALSAEQ
jgi:Centromere/kinetochore Zw10